MPYELVDGLADTLIYSPLHTKTTGSTDSWPVNSQQESGTNTVFENQIEAVVVAEMEEDIIDIVDSEQASSSTSTMAFDFFANPENVVEKQVIVIRKTHCLVDMIEAFTDDCILDANISIRRVLERGDVEAGVGSGVTTDCLTDFWDKFYATDLWRPVEPTTRSQFCTTNSKRKSGLLLLASWPLDGRNFSYFQSNLPLRSLQRRYLSPAQTIYWRLSSTISAQLRRMC